jgi:outer membrane receptor protein involved in Fe transport
MSHMFGPPAATAAAAAAPSRARTVRLPTQNDPAAVAAAQRTQQTAAATGRGLSTILTDQVKQLTGSSGQKLGA